MKYFKQGDNGYLGGRRFVVELCGHDSYLSAIPSATGSNTALRHSIPRESFYVFQAPSHYDNTGFPECLDAVALTWCYHFIRTTLELRRLHGHLQH